MSLKCGNLTLIASNGEEKLLKTNGKVFRIGSYLSCDLVLENSEARRIHCEIQCDAFGRISITNHSKRNPVAINGVPVKGTRPLYTGSLVTVFDRKLRWINNERVSRKHYPISNDANTEVKTPKATAKSEHVPNSAPSLMTRKKKISKRMTMHTLIQNTDMQADDDFQTINDENEDEFQTSLTRESMKCAMKNVGATPPRTTKRISNAFNRRTIGNSKPQQQLFMTPNKEDSNKKETNSSNMMLLKCQSSGMVVTSYSPNATPNKTPKSFAHVMSNKNTPISAYGTPRSVLSELNDDLNSVNNGASPMSPLQSMHLIDFTTPDIYKTPIQKRITPLFQSALKNSAVKSALKSGGRPNHTFSKVAEESPGSLGNRNTTLSNSSVKKIRWNSGKKIESPTHKKIMSTSLAQTPGIVKKTPSKEIPNTTEKSLARKSISRLSFADPETTQRLLRKQFTMGSSPNTPVRSTARMSSKKSMNRSISTPLKTPKAIFAESSAEKKSSRLSLFNRNTPKKNSSIIIESNITTLSPKNSTSKSTNSTNELHVGLTRSTTFILEGPTVPQTIKNDEIIDTEDTANADDTFTCEEDAELVVATDTSLKTEITPLNEEMDACKINVIKPMDDNSEHRQELNMVKFLNSSQNKKSSINCENKTSPDSQIRENINKMEIKNDLSDVEGVKHLYSTRSMVKTPIFKGIKELLQTPKPQPEVNLIGIKELVNTPKNSPSLDNVKGMKELFNTPIRNDLSDLLGVKDIFKTPSSQSVMVLGPPKSIEVKQSINLTEDLLKTPRELSLHDDMESVSKIFITPVSKFVDLSEEETENKTNENENMESLEESFDKLIGKPMIKHTYGRASMTPKVIAKPELHESPEDCVKTDIQEWVDNVENITQSDEELCINTTQTNNGPTALNSDSPTIELNREPLAASSSIKPKLRRSLRKIDYPSHAVEITEMSGIEQLDATINSGSEFSGVLLYSDESENDASVDVNIDESTARKAIASRLAKTNSCSPRKSVQFADIGPLKMTPQIRRIRGRIATPSVKKTPISQESIKGGPFNDLSIQFIDESTVIDSETSENISRYRINQSKNGTDVSIEPVDKDPDNAKLCQTISDSLQTGDEEDFECISVTDSVDELTRKSKRKSRKTINEKGYVIFISDEEIESSDDNENIPICVKNSPIANVALDQGKIRNIGCGSGRKSTNLDISSKSNEILETPRSRVQRLTRNRENIGEEINNSENNVTTKIVSFEDSKSYAAEESKLLDLYELEVTNGKNVTNSVEDMSVQPSEATMSAELSDETFGNFKERPCLRETRAKSQSAEKTVKMSKPSRKTLGQKSKNYSFTLEKLRKFKTESLLASSSSSLLKTEFSKENDQVEELNGSTKTLWNSVVLDTTSNTDIERDLSTTEEGLDLSFESCSDNIDDEFENFTEKPNKVSQCKSQTPNLENKRAQRKSMRKTLGSVTRANDSFDYKTELERRNMSLEFKNFKLEGPKCKTSRGRSQYDHKTSNFSVKNRLSAGQLPASESFDYGAELERRNMSIEFKNFKSDTKITERKGKSQSVQKKSKSVRDNRQTMGKSPLSESFDYEAELNRRNLSLEFQNFDADEMKVKIIRGRSESPEKKDKSAMVKRYTVGQNPANKSFDYEAELERRNMSIEFQNFESDGPIVKPVRGRSTSLSKKLTVSVGSVRRTLGVNASNQSFDYEAELERRNMSLEFENFKSDGQVAKVIRGQSMSPQKKINPDGVNKRRTVGQKPTNESFDYDGELERRNMSLEFQNFELEDAKPRVFRARSQSPQKKIRRSTNSRRTLGQTHLSQPFNYEAELERRNMSLEFQNFESEDTKTRAIRGRSQSPQKKIRKSTNSRRTLGQTPLSQSFNYEAELERRHMSLEFQHFESEDTKTSAIRGRSQSPQKKIRRSTNSRRTLGQTPLSQSFNYEAELERRNMSLEFKNFNENPSQVVNARPRSLSPETEVKGIARSRRTVGAATLSHSFDYDAELERRNMSIEFANFDDNEKNRKVAGARSVSPAKEARRTINKRRTVGQGPLNDSFDYDQEMERRKMNLEFSNFDESKPVMKTARGYSASPCKKIEKLTNTRKTLGQKPNAASFDFTAEKERFEFDLEFSSFEDRPKLKLSRAGSMSPVRKTEVTKTNRRTMGNETQINLDLEHEKMKYLQGKNSSNEINKEFDESPVSTTDNCNESEQKSSSGKKRKLFSHQTQQIEEEIENVTEEKHYEVSMDDEAEIVFKEHKPERTRTRNKSSKDSETLDEAKEMKVTRRKRQLPAETKSSNPENHLNNDASRHVHFGDTVYYEIASKKDDEKTEVDSEKSSSTQNKRAKRVGRKVKVAKETSSENEVTNTADQLENELEKAEEPIKESKDEPKILDSKTHNIDEIVENIASSVPVISLQDQKITKPRGRRVKKTVEEVISSEHEENNLNNAKPITKPKSRRYKKGNDEDDVINISEVAEDSKDAGQKIVLIEKIPEVTEVLPPSSKPRGRRGKKPAEEIKIPEIINTNTNVEDRKLEEIPTEQLIETVKVVQLISNNRSGRGKLTDVPVADAIETPEEAKNRTDTTKDEKLSEEILTDQILESVEILQLKSVKGRRGRKADSNDKENETTEKHTPVPIIEPKIANEPIAQSRARQPRNVQVPEAEEILIIDKPQLLEEKPAKTARGRRAKIIEEIKKENSESITDKNNHSKEESNQSEQISQIPLIDQAEENKEMKPKARGRRKVLVEKQESTTPQQLDVNVNQLVMRVTRSRSQSIDTPIKKLGLATKETSTPITPIIGNKLTVNADIEFKTPINVAPRGRTRLASTLDSTPITPIDQLPDKKTTRPRGRRAALQPTESGAEIESKTEVKSRSRSTRNGSTTDDQTTPSTNVSETDNVVDKPKSNGQLAEKKPTRPRGRRAALQENESIVEIESKTKVNLGLESTAPDTANESETNNVVAKPKSNEQIAEKKTIRPRGRRAALQENESSAEMKSKTEVKLGLESTATDTAKESETDNVVVTPKSNRQLAEKKTTRPRGRRAALQENDSSAEIESKTEVNLGLESTAPDTSNESETDNVVAKPNSNGQLAEKKTTRPRGRRAALQENDSSAEIESKTEVNLGLESTAPDTANESETDNVVVKPNSNGQLAEKKATRPRGRRAALQENDSSAEIESKTEVNLGLESTAPDTANESETDNVGAKPKSNGQLAEKKTTRPRGRRAAPQPVDSSAEFKPAAKLRVTTDNQNTPVANVSETDNIVSTPKTKRGRRAAAVVEEKPAVSRDKDEEIRSPTENKNTNDVEEEGATTKTKRTRKVKVPKEPEEEENENTSAKSRERGKRKISESDNIAEAPKRATRARRK